MKYLCTLFLVFFNSQDRRLFCILDPFLELYERSYMIVSAFVKSLVVISFMYVLVTLIDENLNVVPHVPAWIGVVFSSLLYVYAAQFDFGYDIEYINAWRGFKKIIRGRPVYGLFLDEVSRIHYMSSSKQFILIMSSKHFFKLNTVYIAFQNKHTWMQRVKHTHHSRL